MNLQPLARRLSRLTTDIVVRRPRLWFLLRGLTRFQFGRLAPQWDAIRAGDTAYAPYEAALERVDPPKRALDLGTGTGGAAFAIAHRFPEAEVIGVDLAQQMIAQARGKLTDDLAGRVRFEVADAARLPYGGESFDLVGLSNMIPFFDELERVLAPGGSLIVAFSGGADTPIYVPPERLREQLGRRGFTDFAEFSTDPGTALLARKAEHA
ncbi:MAG: methyltransferase domain-containing protein [Actinobacteria bacterium]|nr:MAG: methyltransferase domain-containing protein [Actinomycetota bacterium]